MCTALAGCLCLAFLAQSRLPNLTHLSKNWRSLLQRLHDRRNLSPSAAAFPAQLISVVCCPAHLSKTNVKGKACSAKISGLVLNNICFNVSDDIRKKCAPYRSRRTSATLASSKPQGLGGLSRHHRDCGNCLEHMFSSNQQLKRWRRAWILTMRSGGPQPWEVLWKLLMMRRLSSTWGLWIQLFKTSFAANTNTKNQNHNSDGDQRLCPWW